MTVSGLLVIDKPLGLTSHDVVAKIRKKLQTRRVGHAGTLDPDATGLLLVCVGEATRLLEYMTATEKRYSGTCLLGIGTDTDDATGEVTERASAASIQALDIEQIIPRFLGDISQTVPRYSAVHIDGKRAYDLARAGTQFDLPVRTIHISELTLVSPDCDASCTNEVLEVHFTVRCSKGTYIRSLCRDIGQALGVPAHMSSLRRIESGSITEADSITLDAFLASNEPIAYLRQPLAATQNVVKLVGTLEQVQKLALGQKVLISHNDQILSSLRENPRSPRPKEDANSLPEEIFVLYNDQVAAVAVMSVGPEGDVILRPRKVFWKREQGGIYESDTSTSH